MDQGARPVQVQWDRGAADAGRTGEHVANDGRANTDADVPRYGKDDGMKNIIENLKALTCVCAVIWGSAAAGLFIVAVALSPLALLIYGIYKVAQLFVK